MQNDDHRQQLLQYIQEQLQAGHSSQIIRETLLNSGWNQGLVDKALSFATGEDSGLAHALPSEKDALQENEQDTPPISAPYHESIYHDPQGYNSIGAQEYAPYPEHIDTAGYGVIEAARDTVVSIQNNIVAFIISAIGGFGLFTLVAYLFQRIGFEAWSSDLLAHKIFTDGSGAYSGVVLLVLAQLCISSIYTGLITPFIAVALVDGALDRESPIVPLWKEGWRLLPHVLKTQLSFFFEVYAPTIIAVVLLSPFALLLRTSGETRLPLSGVLLFVAFVNIIWAIVMGLRYAMAPFVAVFEPHLSVRDTLRRSKTILHGRNQWFLIKAMFLMGIIYAAVFSFYPSSGPTSDKFASFGFALASSFVGLFYMGLLVMLYGTHSDPVSQTETIPQ